MGKHWLDGLYTFKGSPFFCHEVKGEKAFWRNLSELEYPEFKNENMPGTWTYGKYHETTKEIEEKTGAKHYDLEISYMNGQIKNFGVLHEDGMGATCSNLMGNLDELVYLTPEKLQEYLDDREQDSR